MLQDGGLVVNKDAASKTVQYGTSSSFTAPDQPIPFDNNQFILSNNVKLINGALYPFSSVDGILNVAGDNSVWTAMMTPDNEYSLVEYKESVTITRINDMYATIVMDIYTNTSKTYDENITFCEYSNLDGDAASISNFIYSNGLYYGMCVLSVDHVLHEVVIFDPNALVKISTVVINHDVSMTYYNYYVYLDYLIAIYGTLAMDTTGITYGCKFDLLSGDCINMYCDSRDSWCKAGASAGFLMPDPEYDYLVHFSSNGSPILLDLGSGIVKQVTYFYAGNYMLSYSYGVCNMKAINPLFVNITSAVDYSVVCQDPNGMYYQGPNVWYTVPASCAFMQPNELLNNCTEVKNSMNELKSNTCESSYSKLCTAMYDKNPPYSCTRTTTNGWQQIVGTSFANTLLIFNILTIAIGFALERYFTLSNNSDNLIRKKSREYDGVDDETKSYYLLPNKSAQTMDELV